MRLGGPQIRSGRGSRHMRRLSLEAFV